MLDKKIARIILAAGAGSRMGQIKALLNLAGKTALQRIATLNLPKSSMSTTVVGGFSAAEVAKEAQAHGALFISNDQWERGQTGSLCAGLQSVQDADYFLLHPVDLPLIQQSDYDAIARLMIDDPGREIYVTSIGERRGHPLVFSTALAQKILQLGPDDSIRPIIHHEKDVAYAVVSNPWIRNDLDTPDDLAEAQAYLAANGESTSP
ncbi:MAG: molybdenum cofactor cytidylyltransferase [Planctomycetota bacterium]|jgi:molybdenum cofactor cytidylyltransferase